jgi:hypothetical protein
VNSDEMSEPSVVFVTIDDGDVWKYMPHWSLKRRHDAVHAADRPNEVDHWRVPAFEGDFEEVDSSDAPISPTYPSSNTCPQCGCSVKHTAG